ncbi:histidine kinase [Diaminobutyricimonas sp. TR449]|uniref:sensor histidine kinase n=1 Tax=Diaminobutyricimonas sp. TR449 TaxID=2708076 RepID=UPI00141E3532|nr:histidine kinase [Diaminobutyricimonas sp. TR449]
MAGAVAILAALGGAILHAVNDAAGRAQSPSFWLMGLSIAVAYGAVAILLRHSKAAWIRHAAAFIGLTGGIALLAREAAWLGEGPPAAAALWVGSWLWAPAYAVILTVLPHLLPRAIAPLRMPALWLSLVAVVLVSALWATTPYDRQDYPHPHLDARNPFGLSVAAEPVVIAVTVAVLIVATVVAALSLAGRWRRSSGVERQQLKWVVLGVASTVGLAAIAQVLPMPLGEVVVALAMLPVPLSIAVAVLRHGLWEIDVVISRSIVYVVLSAAVIGIYLGAVWLLGSALGDWTGVPVIATALAALGVLPLHARLQRRVNLIVHGEADEPHIALARLGDRLAAASDPGEISARVLPAVVEQVTRSLHLDGARLVLVDGTSASFGRLDAGSATTVELSHAGYSTGELSVSRRGGLSESDLVVLSRLAAQAAVAAHTVLLAHDAHRARESVVVAREEERRRLRRDLHDDIGPALAALALQAELARDLAADQPQAAAQMLGKLVPRLNSAVADVRALVHELRPPTLDDFGLTVSLRELAVRMSTSGTPVQARIPELPELSAAVEVAVYRITAEAVTNAVRHARASVIQVDLTVDEQTLSVSVTDDGVGLPDDHVPGIGLRSMRERAEELGGELTVSSQAIGTSVRARIPITSEPDVPAVDIDRVGVTAT